MTDDEYAAAEAQHLAHMTRFAEAHAAMPAMQRAVLVRLERDEHWSRCVGPLIAEIVPSPFESDTPTP